jgi:hypothetical protein
MAEGETNRPNLARNMRRERGAVFANELLLKSSWCTKKHSSCPDLIRASIHLRKKLFSKKMDCRVIPDRVGDRRPAMTTCLHSRDPVARNDGI